MEHEITSLPPLTFYHGGEGKYTIDWGDMAMVICRQDGDVEIMPVPEAC